MPRSLVTEWKRVATSGKTADGRTIDAQDLRDMAEAYDPAFYTATIWYEHIRYFGSLGTVAELKAEDVDGGKVGLFAKLQPNEYLLRLNKEGQKLFTSIEIQPEFSDTGKAYLRGMAVTDEPASVGTEALHFSRRAEKGAFFANLEPLGDLTATAPESDEAAALSFFARVFNALGKGAPESPATPKEETPSMDPKTVEAFAAAVDKLGTVATSLETSAATFAAKPTEPEKPEGTQPEAGKGEGDKATGVTADQFNTLKTALDELTEKFSAALNQGKGKDVPNTTGAAADNVEAVY